MPNGQFAARKLLTERKHQRMLKKWLKRRKLKLKAKYDPVGTNPRAKALVLQKYSVEQKQPHSGQIKCVKVQLIKNGKVVGAYVPNEGAINFVDEHDEVTIEGLGGSQRGQMGCIPGLKYKVVEVNGANLRLVAKGKKQKPKR
ncbi:30S ribosomal protein S12p [Candidatus Mancarchaeum acidiphilum]|uniref:30S ribosomal protein S12 n=1 Tax=Candidatus Mancarchaeum acidiphilum TaxID=1920749 RepID=A0A218NLN8_9ARCH|nr:30S ribosomal protein S12 [Candidatus Mancarchaeum acidiphilum]ASI13376.1 30S ribosomal protein S12p [Candidatus Mancarchaeum acidiphilum]